MDEKSMTPKHRDVVVKLRERIEQYRRRHSDCQSKQERSLAVIEDQERQEALVLHKRVLESRNTKLLNKIKQQEITKIEHPSNGLELKSTNAILQQQIILKRKHDQSMNNMHMNCDGENGQIGESLSKFSRTDDISNPGLSASMQQSADQQSNPASQPDSMNNQKTTTLVGSNSHFVGDTSRSSPLLAPSGTHTSETFQNANRVSSPNSIPPTEFKKDSANSVAVTSDGGRANGIVQNNSTRSNTETKTAGSVAGQELQQHIKDFERVLMSITNSDMYSNTGMNPDMQMSTRQTSSQIDTVTRDSLNPQQQQQNVQNPSTGQQNPYPTPPTQRPPGPTALHLQQLARQAQSQRAQANSGYLEGQEQDNNQSFRSPMQFMDAIRFAVSGSQQQLQSQTSMQPAQLSASNRYHGVMATNSDQYSNMYSSKDQNHNVIMSTGFPSNSLQYQRMMQTQATQQQAVYSRMGQQGMGQRLSHPSMPEPSSYPAYQSHQNMPHSQYGGMQNLPVYSNSGFQNMRTNQPPFSRQMSLPTPQSYQEQQYPMNQYQMGDQQVPNQQRTDLSSTSYHSFNRQNSFPLYHHSVNQAVGNYGPAGPHPGGPHPGGAHPSYQTSMSQMRNNIPHSASAAMIDSRNNPQSAGYNNYNNQTSFASQSGLQGLMQLPQRNGSGMSQTAAIQQPRTDQQNIQSYAATNMRETANAASLSQDMKYSVRNEVAKYTRAPTFSDPLSLNDPTSTSSSDSHYNPFSPLGSLEKAPSFASLLEQSSGPLNNLETTYTGSIPNLDLLGEIIG